MLRVRALTAVLAFALPCLLPTVASGEDNVPAFVPADGAPVCRGEEGYAADFGGARTFLWRPHWIAALVADEASAARLVQAGEAALLRGPYSVTNKPQKVPGATAHSYASIGPYWWPDPSKKDGLPYIRRDGEVNPQRDGPEFDKARLRDLSQDMRALSLAYHATGDERFARHAMQLARHWFIDEATRMDPHFDFAQGIPGRVNGRGEGIIEASHLSTIVETLGLLRPSPAFTNADEQALRQWYGDFAVWMATSDNGAQELAKNNNHGVFYDFYLAHFALFAGAPEVARNITLNFPRYRLGAQMDRQGRFIEELRRTRSWHYSHYVVDGAARLATIAECVDLDLWSARLEDGRGLESARRFLDRYAADPSSWPFPDRDRDNGQLLRMEQTAQRLRLFWRGYPAKPDEANLP